LNTAAPPLASSFAPARNQLPDIFLVLAGIVIMNMEEISER